MRLPTTLASKIAMGTIYAIGSIWCTITRCDGIGRAFEHRTNLKTPPVHLFHCLACTSLWLGCDLTRALRAGCVVCGVRVVLQISWGKTDSRGVPDGSASPTRPSLKSTYDVSALCTPPRGGTSVAGVAAMFESPAASPWRRGTTANVADRPNIERSNLQPAKSALHSTARRLEFPQSESCEQLHADQHSDTFACGDAGRAQR
jgi:hypothetical protein